MKRKSKAWIVILAVLICAGTIAIVFAQNNAISEKMRQLGQAGRQSETQPDASSEEIAYVGDHIKVLRSDLERVTERVALTVEDPREAEEIALKAVAVREIFVSRAEDAGIPNDDAEFRSWFASYEAGLKSTENYDDILAYIDRMGMTEDEYWEWAKTDLSIRHEWYSNLFIEALEKDFAAQCDAVKGSDGYRNRWNAYLSAYKDEAYANEHLKKASEECA